MTHYKIGHLSIPINRNVNLLVICEIFLDLLFISSLDYQHVKHSVIIALPFKEIKLSFCVLI